MSVKQLTQKQLDSFHQAAQSLKLYRRAELQDESDGSSLIEELYVDPLPNNHILQTMMKPNTTFLIGRKGTGKSTIFQRSQHELRKRAAYTSAYVDIKTVFESCQVDSELLSRAQQNTGILPEPSLKKLLIYRSFLKAVIREIRDELEKRVRSSYLERIKSYLSGSLEAFFEGLDNVLEEADDDEFISLAGLKRVDVEATDETSNQHGTESGLNASVSRRPNLAGSFTAKNTVTAHNTEQAAYSEILMRSFNLKEVILRLKKMLGKLGIRHLYIFVDDFSELPEEAMIIVVDTLLAPLNNWSEELIKFKIAAYPGRIYYGGIDKTKIDEISLDLYDLYGSTDVNTMDEKAIDFTRRLVEERIKHYCKDGLSAYMQPDDQMWRLFFYASMGNPRTLGYVLYYIHESHLLYDKVVGSSAIRDSARRYYEEKIEPYFKLNRFLHTSFAERLSMYGLKELLESIVFRAHALKDDIRKSQLIRSLGGSPPTSHFHVLSNLEPLFSTLELNFFLTKYYQMKDRDAKMVSVFALNYGLCQKYSIEFGRPIGRKGTGTRENRVYLVERVFNCSVLVNEYLQKHQEITCDACHESYGVSQLAALELYGMRCPKCGVGTCQVRNLSKKYEEIIRSVRPEELLPATELGILHVLSSEHKPLFANDISQELDCSYQMVGKRGKILDTRGLVTRNNNDQGRRIFEMTERARQIYFEDDGTNGLDLSAQQDS